MSVSADQLYVGQGFSYNGNRGINMTGAFIYQGIQIDFDQNLSKTSNVQFNSITSGIINGVSGIITGANAHFINVTGTNAWLDNLKVNQALTGSFGAFQNLDVVNATVQTLHISSLDVPTIQTQNLYATGAVITGAYIAVLTGTTIYAQTAEITNVRSSNLTGTNLWITNEVVTTLTGSLGYISTLESTNIQAQNLTGAQGWFDSQNVINQVVTNVTGTNAWFTNETVQTITGSLAFLSTLESSNIRSSNLTGTNAWISNISTQTLTGSLGYISTLESTNIRATNFTGTNVWFDTQNVVNQTVTNFTGTNAWITNETVQTLTGSLAYLTTLESTNVTSSNLTGTNAWISNISTQTLTGSLGYIATLESTNIRSSNFTGTNAWITNASIQVLTGSLGYITTLESTNVRSSNVTGTNAWITNVSTQVLTGSLGYISTLESTNVQTQNLTGTNAWISNVSTQTLTGSLGYISTLESSNIRSSNLTGTNAWITNANIQTLTGSLGYISTLESTNVQVQNLTGTNAWILNVSMQTLTGSLGYISTLEATNIRTTNFTGTNVWFDTQNVVNQRVTNFTGTNVWITNETVQTLTGSLAFLSTLESTNVTSSNLTGTNAWITNASIQTLTGSLGYIATLESTNVQTQNLTGTNLWVQNEVVQTLTGALAYLSTLESTNVRASNLTGTNAWITNISTQVLTGSLGYITTLESTNIQTQNLTGAQGWFDSQNVVNQVVTNVTGTNAWFINETVQTITGSLAYFNTLESTNVRSSNLTGTNAWISNAIVQTLTGAYAALEMVDIQEANIAVLNLSGIDVATIYTNQLYATGAVITGAYISSLTGSYIFTQTLQANNAFVGNMSGTNAWFVNETVTNLIASVFTGAYAALGMVDIQDANIANLNLASIDVPAIYTFNLYATGANIIALSGTNALIDNEVVSNLTGTNAWFSNAFAQTFTGTLGHFVSLDTTNLQSSNFTGTNAWVTNLTAQVLTGSLGYFSTLESTNVRSSNLTGTNAWITNEVVQVLTGTTAYLTTLESTNIRSSNFTGTNAWITNEVVQVLTGTTAYLTTLESTNIRSSNFTGTNAWITNIRATTLTGTTAYLTTLESTNVRTTYLTGTNAWITNAVVDVLTGCTGYFCGIETTNLKATNFTGTNAWVSNLSYSSLTGGNVTFKSATGDYLAIGSTAQTNNLTVTNTSYLAGSVGIGTTNAVQGKLEVWSTIAAVSTAGNPVLTAVDSTNSKFLSLGIQRSLQTSELASTLDLIIHSDAQTYANPWMKFVQGNNYIGFNTGAPAYPLHLYGNPTVPNTPVIFMMESPPNTADTTQRVKIKLKAGGSLFARSSSVEFMNTKTSSSASQWTIINDFDETSTNDLRFVSSDGSTSRVTFLQSGNVGIGTTNPSTLFHVYGSTSEPLAIFQGTTTDTSIRVTSSNSASSNEVYLEIYDQFSNSNNQSWGIGTNDDQNLHIKYSNVGTMNGKDLMKIDVAKSFVAFNPMANSTTPEANIHVMTGAIGNYDMLKLSSYTTSFGSNQSSPGVLFSTYDSANSAFRNFSRVKGTDSVSAGANYGYGDLVVDTSFNGTMSEKMRVTAQGWVGIGTATPTALLDCYTGTGNFANANNSPAQLYIRNNYAGQNTYNSSARVAELLLGDSSFYATIGAAVNNGNYGDSIRLDFRTPLAGNDNTQVTRMTIVPFATKVGIGTTGPTSTLHLNTTSSDFCYLMVSSDSGQRGIYFYDNINSVYRWTNYTTGSDPILNWYAQSSTYSNEVKMSLRPQGALELANSSGAAPYLILYNKCSDSSTSGFYIAKLRTGGLKYGDNIGVLEFSGYDSANASKVGASIYANVASTWTSTTAPTDMLFYTTSPIANTISQKMIITSTGTVGIGTNFPYGMLHVHTGTIGPVISLNLTCATSNFTATENASPGIRFQIQWTGNGAFYDLSKIRAVADPNYALISSGYGDQIFETYTAYTATERMRIKSNGYVGIGTTGPDVELEVNGFIRARRRTALDGCSISIGDKSGGWIMSDRGNNSTPNNNLAWFWYDTWSSLSTQLMVLTTTGKLGIGSTQPSTQLDVNGAVAIMNSTNLPTATNYSLYMGGGYGSPVLGKIYIGDGTGWKMYMSKRNASIDTDLIAFTDSGYIGIGNTGPAFPLHISYPYTTATATYIKVQNKINNITGLILGQDASDNSLIYNQSNANMLFATSNVERMRIATAGNVGIGTNDPKVLLHLEGGNYYQSTGTMSVRTLVGYNIDVAPLAQFHWGGGQDKNYSVSMGFALRYRPNGGAGTNALGSIAATYLNNPPGYNPAYNYNNQGLSYTDIMNFSGNASGVKVGIGTTALTQMLDVYQSGTDNYIRVYAGDGVTYKAGLWLTERDNYYGIAMRYDAASDNLYWSESDAGGALTDKMTLARGGNLGVGTTNPNIYKVTSYTTGHGMGQTDGTVQVGFYVAAATSGQVGTRSNHRLDFFVNNGGPSMTVDTSGYVGLGTTYPESKLHVYGYLNNTPQYAGIQAGFDSNNTAYPCIQLVSATSSGYPYIDFGYAGINASGRIFYDMPNGRFDIWTAGSQQGSLTNKVDWYSWDGNNISVQGARYGYFYGVYVGSDSRIKTNIEPLSQQYCLDQVNKLEVVSYDYRCNFERSETGVVGFIAQQVATVDPNCVQYIAEFIPNINQYVNVVETATGPTSRTYQFEYVGFIGSSTGSIKFIEQVEGEVDGSNVICTYTYTNNTFTCVTNNIRAELSPQTFCYGTQVYDFCTLQKDRLFALGIGAIQDLSHDLTGAYDIINQQQTTIQSHEQTIQSHEQTIQSHEQTIQSQKLSLQAQQQIIQSLNTQLSSLKFSILNSNTFDDLKAALLAL